MSKTFADFQQGVAERIQDAAGKLAADALQSCIREAVTGRYSAARPLLRIADIAGDASTYKWAMSATVTTGEGEDEVTTAIFTGWVEGFSVVRDIEYPAGERDPAMLGKDEWRMYQLDQGQELRLLAMTPASGKTLRVTYTVPHNEDGSDVPDQDFYGAVNLAASLACSRLAALYNQAGDSSIGADAVDYRSKASEYRQLARDLMKAFQAAFGLDADAPQPAASGTAEWKENLEDGGAPLTH